MINQPLLSDYIQDIANYEYFLATILVFAIGIILLSLKFSKKRKSIGLNLNLWTILVIGLIVRVPIMNQPYWYDEAFTSAMNQVPIADFFTAVQGDVHPPLYYLIVRGFTSIFGHTELAMRLPALFSSLGLIVTIYHIGKAYGGVRVAKWSALITALLPAAAYYAVEARYPSFLALLLSIAYIGIQRKKLWLTAIPLALVALTHINGWIYIVIMLAVWVGNNNKLRALILPTATIILWIPTVLIQAKDVSDGFWLPQYPVYQHAIEMTIGTRFVSAWTAFLPMVFVMAIIGLAIWKWKARADELWLIVAIGVPLAQWIVGIVWHPIYLPRTLLFSALLLIIPVAWWLDNYAIRSLVFFGLVGLLIGIASLHLIDRSSQADVAIAHCDGYETIYATNTKTAIFARHYRQDATVILYEQGNSLAQELPYATQRVIFDDVNNLLNMSIEDVCVVSRINMYNTPEEMNHLEAIINSFNADVIFTATNSDMAYYITMRIGEQS